MDVLDDVISTRTDGRVAFADAWLALLTGHGVEASRLFDDACRRAPGDAWMWRGLGLAFAEREIEVRAASLLAHAAELEPEHAETWYWIGQFAPRDTHAPLALTALVRATELAPDIADFWAARAGREPDEDALQSLARATEIDPHNVEAWSARAWVYRSLGRTQDAVDAFRTLVALKRTPATLRSLADELRRAGEHDEAGSVSHDAVSLEDAPRQRSIGPPDGTTEFGLVGRLLLDRGHLETLRAAYTAGAGSRPSATEFWWSFASALTERGRFSEALALLDRLAESTEVSAALLGSVHRDRAVLLEGLDRPKEATTAWELMRMQRDFASFERRGVSALAVSPYGGATVRWTTATANIADPWTRRVRPFQENQTGV